MVHWTLETVSQTPPEVDEHLSAIKLLFLKPPHPVCAEGHNSYVFSGLGEFVLQTVSVHVEKDSLNSRTH